MRRLLRVPAAEEWRMTAMGAVIGLFTGAGAFVFDRALHAVAEWTHHQQGELPLWVLPMIPMVGALLTGIVCYFFAREAGGPGVPHVLEALIRKGGKIPGRIGVVKAIASIATVGSGGSAGTEGPIIQIGSTMGSVAARRFGISREHVPTMVGCGAAAGLASIFNAPIAGVFFAIEILLRDFSRKTFTPIVIASVFATALTQVLIGRGNAEGIGAGEPIFAFELPNYLFTPQELPSYAVLGLLCAGVACAFSRLLHVGEDMWNRMKIHPIVKPVSGAALLGLLGIAYLALVPHQPGAVPEFFGNGYTTITELLDPAAYRSIEGLPKELALLAALLACKMVATVFTLASRGSGGEFAPSMFLGACTGAAFGALLDRLGLIPDGGSPASYALVGMAAVIAGTTFAPLTAILLLFELTREPKVLAPIMLAAILSTLLARALMRDSVYTASLRRAGILIGTGRDLSVMRRVPVATVQTESLPSEPIYASDPLSKLIMLHAHQNVPDFVVTDQDGKYMGMVTGADIRTALIDREAIPLLLVAELMRSDIPTIRYDETLDTVLEKFAAYDVSSLCMTDPDNPSKPIAMVTRARALRRYHEVLEAS